jgi:hypothetical protein
VEEKGGHCNRLHGVLVGSFLHSYLLSLWKGVWRQGGVPKKIAEREEMHQLHESFRVSTTGNEKQTRRLTVSYVPVTIIASTPIHQPMIEAVSCSKDSYTSCAPSNTGQYDYTRVLAWFP